MMSFKSFRQHYREPSFQQCLTKFASTLKDLITKYHRFPFHLVNQSQIFDEHTKKWDRLVSIWERQNIDYEVWCEIGYNYSVNSVEMSLYLTKNYRVASVTGFYYINLAINLFQRYSNQLFYNKQAFQFNIHPISGNIKIQSKLLVQKSQYQIEIGKPEYIYSVVYELRQLLTLGSKFIVIQQYLQRNIDKCPNISFLNRQIHIENKEQLKPEIFLEAIKKSFAQVDPNCQNSLDAFGNQQASNKFVQQHNQNFTEDIAKMLNHYGKKYEMRVKTMKSEEKPNDKEKQVKKLQLTDLLTKVYEASISQDEQILTQKVVRKISILTQQHAIKWEKYANGGFGFIEKAYVEYKISDFSDNDTKIFIGQIVRKSDIGLHNKIAHQIDLLTNYLQNEQHDYILSYYISDQPEYEGYIFSKFESNTSLEKYLKANRNTISLQSLIKIMQNTAKGLMFLEERKIVHLDIKPNNIIITRDLTGKISDFGEAYVQGDKQMYHRGFTLPYVPAQRFEQGEFTSKIDVYSLGVSMFKVFFDGHIWGDINNLNKRNFMKSLKEKSLKVILAPQKFLLYGVPEIIESLANISLKCVSEQPKERPTFFYISAILVFAKFYLHSLIQGGFIPTH